MKIVSDISSARRPRRTLGLDFDWQPTGSDEDPTSRLLNFDWIEIGGLDLHVTAYAVTYDADNCLQIADSMFADEWAAILAIDTDCAYRTITINEREYVIVAHPFGH